MAHFVDFYKAYHFLKEHPLNYLDRGIETNLSYMSCNYFKDNLDVAVVKVNPNHIENGLCVMDGNENDTKTEIWLEFGGVYIADIEFICDFIFGGYPPVWIENFKKHIEYVDGGFYYAKPTFFNFAKENNININNLVTYSHDIELDCGGDTFEEAIIKLANLVRERYPQYAMEN